MGDLISLGILFGLFLQGVLRYHIYLCQSGQNIHAGKTYIPPYSAGQHKHLSYLRPTAYLVRLSFRQGNKGL
ncbi:hypothetical protein B0T10DRAFT_502840, partial [Thelonectria olida]